MKIFINLIKLISIVISFSIFLFIFFISPILYIFRLLKSFSNKKNGKKFEIGTKKTHSPKSEYDRLILEKSKLESDIRGAENINHELSFARNSREKFILHQKCGIKFGYEKPNQVINDRNRRILFINRSIDKIISRINNEEKRRNLNIKHIIIDGNNMCYDGEKFISTRAIYKLLETLPETFEKTVVFDYSIKRLTQKTNKDFETSLSKYGKIYICPEKSPADEYIIKLADQDEYSYIISNDKFSEFYDYRPIIERRTIPFMIMKDSIIINELSINEHF